MGPARVMANDHREAGMAQLMCHVLRIGSGGQQGGGIGVSALIRGARPHPGSGQQGGPAPGAKISPIQWLAASTDEQPRGTSREGGIATQLINQERTQIDLALGGSGLGYPHTIAAPGAAQAEK